MPLKQNCAAWSFINTTALHPDKAVFYNINTSDTVLTSQFVKVLHDLSRIHVYTVYSHTVTALEIEFHIFSVIWRIFRRGS